jgi:hypothetical protein
VHGQSRWLQLPAPDWSRPGRLEITTGAGTAVYRVSVIRSSLACCGNLVGFELAKEGSEAVHHIDITSPWGWRCDCPDASWRDQYATNANAARCKHVVGLREAVNRLTGGPQAA